MTMDIYVKKAVDDLAKAQSEANARLIEEVQVTNRWLAHLCSLVEAQARDRV